MADRSQSQRRPRIRVTWPPAALVLDDRRERSRLRYAWKANAEATDTVSCDRRLAAGAAHPGGRRGRPLDVRKADRPGASLEHRLGCCRFQRRRARARRRTSSSASPASPNRSARYEMTIVALSYMRSVSRRLEAPRYVREVAPRARPGFGSAAALVVAGVIAPPSSAGDALAIALIKLGLGAALTEERDLANWVSRRVVTRSRAAYARIARARNADSSR